MKCLKIADGKGHYSLNGVDWLLLDEIKKEHILAIVTTCLDERFEMDDPSVSPVHNKAHEIIYSNLYTKFLELEDNQSRFKDDSENLFKEAIAKYKE
ncbi:MAG: hypothetical protein ACI9YE_002109 [Psychroserpens sp.]|jgi:hypothetical protein